MGLSFLAEIDPGPLALWASMFGGGNSTERIATVEAALKSKRGAYWRGEIGKWIGRPARASPRPGRLPIPFRAPLRPAAGHQGGAAIRPFRGHGAGAAPAAPGQQ